MKHIYCCCKKPRHCHISWYVLRFLRKSQFLRSDPWLFLVAVLVWRIPWAEDMLNAWKHTAAWNYLYAVTDAPSASWEWMREQGTVKFSGEMTGGQLWSVSRPSCMKSAAASSVNSAAFISKRCSYLEERRTVTHSLCHWQALLKSNLERDHLDSHLHFQGLCRGWKMCFYAVWL